MPRLRRPTPIERLTARTLKSIAEELGVSSMRVLQIEREALKKIRKQMIERRIVTREGRYSQ